MKRKKKKTIQDLNKQFDKLKIDLKILEKE